MVVNTRRYDYYYDHEQRPQDSDDDRPDSAGAKGNAGGRQGQPKEDDDYDSDSSDFIDASLKHSKNHPKKAKPAQGKHAKSAKPTRPAQNSEPRNPVNPAFSQGKENRREKSSNGYHSSTAKKTKETPTPPVSQADIQTFMATSDARKARDKARIKELQDQEDQLKEELEEMQEKLTTNDHTVRTRYEKQDHVLKSERSLVKAATKKVYRTVKFINTDDQLQKFGDLVMDATNIEDLQFSEKDTKVQKATIRNNRSAFRDDHEKYWISTLNELRNYNQVSTSNVKILPYKPTIPDLTVTIVSLLLQSRS